MKNFHMITVDGLFRLGVIEIRFYWWWFKDLFTFKRRTYDGKLFAVRRLWYHNGTNDKEYYRSWAIWFLEITWWKEKEKTDVSRTKEINQG